MAGIQKRKRLVLASRAAQQRGEIGIDRCRRGRSFGDAPQKAFGFGERAGLAKQKDEAVKRGRVVRFPAQDLPELCFRLVRAVGPGEQSAERRSEKGFVRRRCERALERLDRLFFATGVEQPHGEVAAVRRIARRETDSLAKMAFSGGALAFVHEAGAEHPVNVRGIGDELQDLPVSGQRAFEVACPVSLDGCGESVLDLLLCGHGMESQIMARR